MKIRILPSADRNNGWLEILPPLPPANRASGGFAVDFAIVGAGFTGLAAARRLAELRPEASIALIEAGRIGNNAAGRCSGFAIDQAHNIRAKDFAQNLAAERTQTSINRAGQNYLKAAVIKHAIGCDWDESGKVHGAATPKGARALQSYARNLDLLQAPYSWMSANDMKRLTGSGFYTCGLHTPGTILIQPAALVLGLAKTLPDNVEVYEESPVTNVEYGSPHTLRAGDARIATRVMLLANNGFAGQFGCCEKHLIPVVTWGSLSRVMTEEEIGRLGGTRNWGVIPANPFGSSVRRTLDNRILIRNIYNYCARLNPTETDRIWARGKHEASLRNRFPMLPELEFEYTWGGPLSLSRNGKPGFGAFGDNVYGAFCLNGVGIARGTAYGKLLAEHIVGETSELLTIMRNTGRPNRLPPRPLLDLGVRIDFARRRHAAGREL